MSTKNTKMNNKQAKAIAKQAAADAVKRERKLNRKVAKQHGNQLIAKVGDMGAGNMYLKTLLNPEQYQTSYPDSYDKKTAVVQFILNRTLQVDPEEGFYLEVHPTLKGHVVTDSVNAAVTKRFLSVNTFIPKGFPIKSAGPNTNIPIAAPSNPDDNTTLNLIDGATFELPKLAADASIYAKWVSTSDANVSLYATTQAGVNIALTNDNTTPAVIPAATTSLAITAAVTGGGAPQALQTLYFSIITPVLNLSTDLAHLDVTSYPDLVGGSPGDGTSPICEEYRVVGMSTLVTFEGDVLYNGGAITARCLDGGETAGGLGLKSYSTIAGTPGSFEGPLKTGIYSFWKPTDDRDMYFRDPKAEDLSGDLPSLVCAGYSTHADNVIIRLRTCMVVEMKTVKPFMSTSYSVVDPKQIADAAVLLRGIPRIMENPIHLESIKNFLGSLLKKGEQMYEAGAKIAPYAIPLAKAVGSFLI